MQKERIIDKNLATEYQDSAKRYAIYVSRERITADYRDGLKPVQRRIIYSMYQQGYTSPSKKKKSADVVGSVIAKYHPHSTDAVYDTMVNMANWYKIKMPMIFGYGNWGSLLGDKAAAYRYTEASLNYFAMDCVLKDISTDKNAVDWQPNYDESTTEPMFLAPSVPLLLINGTMGIGVGMKTDIPRHNLAEVIDETLKLIANPNHEVVLVPDLCLPCEIIDTDWKAISRTGFGNYKVRGIIEETQYEGYPALVIKSMPDYTFLDTIKDKINDLVESKMLLQIRNTFDFTDLNGVNYIIQLKQGSDPNYVKDMLYKHTGMESSCRVNFEILDGLKLMRVGYTEYLKMFIEFRKLTKFRLHCNEVQGYKTRFHHLDAFIKVLESGEIDTIYKSIRKRKDTDDSALIEYLIKKVGLTDLQAAFIINSDLRKMSIGYLNKYKQEAADLTVKINDLMNKILDDRFIMEEIVQELVDYRNKYGSPRICKLVDKATVENIPRGEFVVLVTNRNFIKKIPVGDNLLAYKDDGIRCIRTVQNTDTLLIFDEKGKVFKLDTHKIPLTAKNQTGCDLRLMNKYIGANIMAIYSKNFLEQFVNKDNAPVYLVMVTKSGYCKKVDLSDCISAPPSGIFYIKLEDDDYVKEVLVMDDSQHVMIYSDKKAIKIPVATIPYLKRNTRGSRAMNNATTIDGMCFIDDHSDVVVVTEKGKANRLNAVAVPLQERGGTGHNVIKLGSGDRIKSIIDVYPNSIIRLKTISNTRLDIDINDIPVGSTVSTGNKLVSARDTIIGVEVLSK